MGLVGSVSIVSPNGEFALDIPDLWTLSNPEDVISRTMRTNDTPHPTQNGSIFGVDRIEARTIIFDIAVHADPSIMSFALTQLSTIFAPGVDSSVKVNMYEGDQRQLFGRPRNFAVDASQYGFATVKAQYVCADPLMYALDPTYGTLFAATFASGLMFPLTFPFTFTIDTSTGADTVLLPNNGNIAAPYEVWFPAGANQKLTNEVSGQFLQLVQDVPDGMTVTARSRDRSVLLHLDGDASNYDSTNVVNVYHWLSADSRWFDVVPGANTFHYEESSGAGNFCVVKFFDAWI